jgi:hypothetical protein
MITMPQTKEEKYEYNRLYCERNKEKLKEKRRLRESNQDTKDRKKETNRLYYKNNSEKVREANRKKYWEDPITDNERTKANRTKPNIVKSLKISDMKRKGIIHDDYNELYDIFLNTHNCMICDKSISGYNKHVDHCHETGEYRQILCCSCNTFDFWKKRIFKYAMRKLTRTSQVPLSQDALNDIDCLNGHYLINKLIL